MARKNYGVCFVARSIYNNPLNAELSHLMTLNTQQGVLRYLR